MRNKRTCSEDHTMHDDLPTLHLSQTVTRFEACVVPNARGSRPPPNEDDWTMRDIFRPLDSDDPYYEAKKDNFCVKFVLKPKEAKKLLEHYLRGPNIYRTCPPRRRILCTQEEMILLVVLWEQGEGRAGGSSWWPLQRRGTSGGGWVNGAGGSCVLQTHIVYMKFCELGTLLVRNNMGRERGQRGRHYQEPRGRVPRESGLFRAGIALRGLSGAGEKGGEGRGRGQEREARERGGKAGRRGHDRTRC